MGQENDFNFERTLIDKNIINNINDLENRQIFNNDEQGLYAHGPMFFSRQPWYFRTLRPNQRYIPKRLPKVTRPKIKNANPSSKGQPKTPSEILDDLRPFPHQPRTGDITPEGGIIPPIIFYENFT